MGNDQDIVRRPGREQYREVVGGRQNKNEQTAYRQEGDATLFSTLLRMAEKCYRWGQLVVMSGVPAGNHS